MKGRAALAVLGAAMVAGVVFAGGPETAAAASRAWLGGATNNLWSDPDNWSNGIVPVAGDEISFPDGAQRKVNVNDLPAGTVFDSIRFGGSGYSISGNAVSLTNELRTGFSSGTNTLALDVSGTADVWVQGGRLILQGDNSYTGQVFVDVGRLVAGTDTALGSDVAGVNVSDGGTLILGPGVDTGDEDIEIYGHGWDDNGTLQALGGSSRAGMVTVGEDSTIGVGNATLTIGTLFGPGPLALVGGGKLQVDTSFYTGSIDVVNGNLTWNGSSQAFVTVRGNGWLRGLGTVASANVSGGLIWPGSGSAPGVLTVAGATVFDAGIFQVDLDGPTAGTGYGQLATGNLTLSPVATLLDIDLGYTPGIGQVFTIISVGSGAVSGTFLDLPEGAVFTAEGFAWQISYVGGDGNDVTLTLLREVTADLQMALAASPSPVAAGGLLTYTAVVTNEGPDTATGPVVTMGTPVGTTFESATGPANWVCSKPTNTPSLQCTGPALPDGATATFTFVFRVNQGTAGPISGTAAVFSNTEDPFSANNAEQAVTPVGPGGAMQFRLVIPGVARDSGTAGGGG